jgi:hypothetical protein
MPGERRGLGSIRAQEAAKAEEIGVSLPPYRRLKSCGRRSTRNSVHWASGHQAKYVGLHPVVLSLRTVKRLLADLQAVASLADGLARCQHRESITKLADDLFGAMSLLWRRESPCPSWHCLNSGPSANSPTCQPPLWQYCCWIVACVGFMSCK